MSVLGPKKKSIISTGGGIILRSENKTALKESGFVVWLKASLEESLNRLKADHSRPLLNQPNKAETFSNLFNQRIPLYKETANLIVETDGKSFQEIGEIIWTHFQSQG